MFKKILVPVDFTKKNEAAIEAAAKLATADGGEITLFHVIEKIKLLSPAETRGFYNSLKNNAELKIRKYVKKFGNGTKFKSAIVLGNRAEEIVQHSIEEGADVIVMASHKIDPDHPSEGWGTISYKVAILSQCPVLLVK